MVSGNLIDVGFKCVSDLLCVTFSPMHTLSRLVSHSTGGLKGEVGLVCVRVPLPNAYVHVPCLVTAWVGPEQKSSPKSRSSLNGKASV